MHHTNLQLIYVYTVYMCIFMYVYNIHRVFEFRGVGRIDTTRTQALKTFGDVYMISNTRQIIIRVDKLDRRVSFSSVRNNI